MELVAKHINFLITFSPEFSFIDYFFKLDYVDQKALPTACTKNT